jgi:hypothetical protein
MGSKIWQPTTELGVRMALGAQREQVLRLMLFDGLRPAILGLALGSAASARDATDSLHAVRHQAARPGCLRCSYVDASDCCHPGVHNSRVACFAIGSDTGATGAMIRRKIAVDRSRQRALRRRVWVEGGAEFLNKRGCAGASRSDRFQVAGGARRGVFPWHHFVRPAVIGVIGSGIAIGIGG